MNHEASTALSSLAEESLDAMRSAPVKLGPLLQ